MEKSILLVFTEALELVKPNAYYKYRIFIEPQNITAFKRITIELYEWINGSSPIKIVSYSSIEKYTNEEERIEALQNVAVVFISEVLKYFKV